ncbi:MAG: phage tail tape measure protein, partial [Selenomonadaceae bacterium]|nr:phage tail tape measure protein [Selenomonadaceae bacterium]
MSKTYQVKFDILGNLDPSLLAAIQNAQKSIKSLSGLNGKALANAQKLSAAQGKLNSLVNYKDTLRAVQNLSQARAGEVLTANRSLAQQKAAQQQLDVMKREFKELVKVQTRLKQNAQTQRNGLDLARAELKAAKAAGDVAAIKAAQQAFQAQQESARRAAQAVKEINQAVKLGRAELKAQEQSVKTLGNNFAQASQKAQQLQQQLQQQQAQLNQLRAAAPNNLGQAESHLRAEIQATTQALNQEIAAIERRNQVFNNFSQRQQDLYNAWGNFQNAIQTAQSIMTPFKDAADNAMTFEFAMSKVKALTSMQNIRGGNLKQVEADMAALTAQAERLGATTEFTSTEVAKAMGRYGYSGWNAQQIQAVMAQTVDFASVTGKHNIDRAADIFSDDLTILGIKAGDKIQVAGGKMVDAVSHTFDNYAYAITKANLDEEALHTSLTYNAPAMMLAGLTQGEIFASNMIAANAGLKGSTSGTAFRTGWIRMLAPPKKGAKALEELGMTATESQKQMAAASEEFAKLGVTATSTARERLMALKTAYDANAALGEEGRGKNAAMLDAIIGKNAFSTWANLFKGNNLQQMFEWADYMDSGKTAGWNADTAKVMRDNTQTQIEYVKSALDALQRNAGQALLPTIRGAAEMFAPLISSAAEFVAQNPAIIQACAAIAA